MAANSKIYELKVETNLTKKKTSQLKQTTQLIEKNDRGYTTAKKKR